MIREALQYLAELKQRGDEFRTVKLPEHWTTFVSKPDGTTMSLEMPFPCRSDCTSDVASFIAEVNDYGGEETSVWIGEEYCVGVINDTERRNEIVMLNLLRSDTYDVIRKELPAEWEQKTLVRWLKKNFSLDTKLLASVRKIDFSRKSDGTRTVEHGKESLGKSVEAKVQNIEDIPELTTVKVPRYSNAGLRQTYSLELRVDVDPTEETIWLGVAPDAMEMLNAKAEAEVRKTLVAGLNEHINVYIGQTQLHGDDGKRGDVPF